MLLMIVTWLLAPGPVKAPYKTPLTLAEMTNKQAVVETTEGTFVIEHSLSSTIVSQRVEKSRLSAVTRTLKGMAAVVNRECAIVRSART